MTDLDDFGPLIERARSRVGEPHIAPCPPRRRAEADRPLIDAVRLNATVRSRRVVRPEPDRDLLVLAASLFAWAALGLLIITRGG